MRRSEQPRNQFFRQWRGQEFITNVPAGFNGAIDGGAFIRRKSLGCRKAAVLVRQHRSIPNNAKTSRRPRGAGLSRQAGLLTSDHPLPPPSQITLKFSGKALKRFRACFGENVPFTALGTCRNCTGFPILPHKSGHLTAVIWPQVPAKRKAAGKASERRLRMRRGVIGAPDRLIEADDGTRHESGFRR